MSPSIITNKIKNSFWEKKFKILHEFVEFIFICKILVSNSFNPYTITFLFQVPSWAPQSLFITQRKLSDLIKNYKILVQLQSRLSTTTQSVINLLCHVVLREISWWTMSLALLLESWVIPSMRLFDCWSIPQPCFSDLWSIRNSSHTSFCCHQNHGCPIKWWNK